MNQKYIPSVQLTELIKDGGASITEADVLARALESGFYGAVESRVFDDDRRAAEFSVHCRENGILWTSWASSVIYGEGLNLTTKDSAWRRHSMERVKDLLHRAAQQGADAFAILSGVRPENDADLPEAIQIAADSMCELAMQAKQYGKLRLLIEPLDRDVHKHGTIGTAEEAAAVIRVARREHEHVYMVWDSAHMKLQQGDLCASLREAGNTIGHIHLCDAVIEKESPLYGDYHPMPGVSGGYLDENCGAQILREAKNNKLLLPEIPVAMEAKPDCEVWIAEAKLRAMLNRILKMA